MLRTGITSITPRKTWCARGSCCSKQHPLYPEPSSRNYKHDAAGAFPTISWLQGSSDGRRKARYCFCRVWRRHAVFHCYAGPSELQNNSSKPNVYHICEEVMRSFCIPCFPCLFFPFFFSFPFNHLLKYYSEWPCLYSCYNQIPYGCLTEIYGSQHSVFDLLWRKVNTFCLQEAAFICTFFIVKFSWIVRSLCPMAPPLGWWCPTITNWQDYYYHPCLGLFIRICIFSP